MRDHPTHTHKASLRAVVRSLTPASIAIPVDGLDQTATPMTSCGLLKTAFESTCCGANEATELYPYKAGGGDIFAKGGSHISHAETFSGTKIQGALARATRQLPASEIPCVIAHAPLASSRASPL